MAETKDTEPAEPEAPDAIVWARWLSHYLLREGAVIRRAPLATAVIAVAMFFAARWVVQTQDAGTINGLTGAITTKDAEIQFLDQRLQGYENKSPESASTSRARIKWVNVYRVRDGRPDAKTKMYGWGMTFQNAGNGPAISPIHSQAAWISEKVITESDSAVLDAEFAKLYNELPALEKANAKNNNEIQPGDSSSFDGLSGLTEKQVDDEVVKGPKFLYTIALIAYKDGDTPPGKLRFTEVCNFSHSTEPQTSCPGHNRIYLPN